MRLWAVILGGCALLLFELPARGADGPSEQEATRLCKAVTFYRDSVSASGGYLWRYSADLARQEGEGQASRETAWVQPPGTPTVGEAYLLAYQATREAYCREAAIETGMALVRGQLLSGGWDYRIEFAPNARRKYAYRVEGGGPDTRNVTTLDDNTTQSALRFLMRLDRELEFQNKPIHECVEYALEHLLAAQYPNGAWPQRFSEPPDPALHPVRSASYPESWSREYPSQDYRGYYTFNDNSIADMIATMFDAARIYDQPRYRESAEKAGGFILLAQMPDPQPAWAQQYNSDMHPAWARKFEPPAVTGGESQGILRVLLSLYRETGNDKYLKPVPRAIEYLRKSQLKDGQLARFYELQTNRPLYFTKQYELTYSDADMPTHYGFQVGSGLKSIEADYRRLLESGPPKPRQFEPSPDYRMSNSLRSRAREIIAAQDARGAWVEPGRLRSYGDDDPTREVLDSRTLARNVQTLATYIAAARSDR